MIQTAALKVEAGDDTGRKRQCKVLMTGERVEEGEAVDKTEKRDERYKGH